MSFFDLLRRKESVETTVNQDPIMIVGLGNPGREYRETRHNIGFMVIDRLAEKYGIKLSRVQNKAITGSGIKGDTRIILVKPQTYMNLSGQSVSSLVRFYKIKNSNLIIAHDDVDLPFGSIRMRPGGGSAGQKGIASIISQLGSQDFPRLRMGIGRPPGKMDAAAYVLEPFTSSEKEYLISFLDRAVLALDCYIIDGLESAMNRYNQVEPT